MNINIENKGDHFLFTKTGYYKNLPIHNFTDFIYHLIRMFDNDVEFCANNTCISVENGIDLVYTHIFDNASGTVLNFAKLLKMSETEMRNFIIAVKRTVKTAKKKTEIGYSILLHD